MLNTYKLPIQKQGIKMVHIGSGTEAVKEGTATM